MKKHYFYHILTFLQLDERWKSKYSGLFFREKRKRPIMPLLGILLFLFVLLPVHICSGSMVSDELARVAKEYYDQGEYSKAVHEFSKALLLDPGNEEILSYLNKMGIKEGLYGFNSNPISQIDQLSGLVEDYKDEFQSLSKENNEISHLNKLLQEDKTYFQEAIRSKEEENEFLRNRVVQAKNEAEQQHARDKHLVLQSDELVQKKSGDIARLNADLYDIKNRFVETEIQLKEEVKENDVSEKRLNRHIKHLERQWREERLDYEDGIRAAERKFNRYQYSIRRTDDIKKRRVVKLSGMLHKRKLDLIHANNKGLMVGYKLSNRERQIAAKNRAIFELKESLAFLDQEVIYLKVKLRDQYEFKQMLKASSYEEDFASRKIFNKQQSFITDLKDKLTKAQEKIKTLSEEDEVVAADKIKELKMQLQKMQEELQKTTSELKERDDVYDVMEKRLEDAQERTQRVEEIVQEKEARMDELEEQLTNVLTQFE